MRRLSPSPVHEESNPGAPLARGALVAAPSPRQEPPWSVRLVLRMIFHMFVHATWISICFPLAMLLAIVRPKGAGMWVAREIWTPFLIYMSEATLTVEGLENVDPLRPTVYVSNHQSTFDIPVLIRVLPVNFRFVAKEQLRWVPVLGWYLWFAGHILIDRSNRTRAIASLARAAEKIRAGTSILMYPEGTRSPDGHILPFKKGPFALALKAGVAICPVTIEGTARLMPKNSWKIHLGGEIKVKIGKPIDASAYGDNRDRLMRDVRDVIISQSFELGGPGGDRDDVVAARGQEGISERGAGA